MPAVTLFRRSFNLRVAYLCHPASETVPGHAGGRQSLLSDQQELREWPPGARTPMLRGQDDGGEQSTLAYQSSESYLCTSVVSCNVSIEMVSDLIRHLINAPSDHVLKICALFLRLNEPEFRFSKCPEAVNKDGGYESMNENIKIHY